MVRCIDPEGVVRGGVDGFVFWEDGNAIGAVIYFGKIIGSGTVKLIAELDAVDLV